METGPSTARVTDSGPSGSPQAKRNSTKRKRGFELNSKGLFLTYPQCPLSPSEALDLLVDLTKKKKRTIVEYIIATEKHQDGNDHLHAWIKLNKAVFLRDANYFDLKNHHGNYQGARNPARVKAYCTKEGNFIADPPYQVATKKTPWSTAMELARTGQVTEAMTELERGGDRSCRDSIIHRPSILASLKSLAPPEPLKAALPLTNFSKLFVWEKTKALLLCGATNTGKTTLAASLLPMALFTRHLDRLAELTDLHEGVILDDMSFIHLHDEAQIALLDVAMSTDVHIRYRVATLRQGLPRIITTNKEPREIFNMSNGAIARRIQAIRWWGWDRDPSWDVCV